MAISQTMTLPNQPGSPLSGAVHRTPLGGDGFRAPMAAYILDNIQLTGDAGGGAVTIQVNMDERFCSLVAYMVYSNSQATPAAVGIRFRIDTAEGSSPIAPQVQSVFASALASTVSTSSINEIFTPTPVIIPGGGAGGLITVASTNALSDNNRLSALIYLFNINVRQVMPMGPLLWARGST